MYDASNFTGGQLSLSAFATTCGSGTGTVVGGSHYDYNYSHRLRQFSDISAVRSVHLDLSVEPRRCLLSVNLSSEKRQGDRNRMEWRNERGGIFRGYRRLTVTRPSEFPVRIGFDFIVQEALKAVSRQAVHCSPVHMLHPPQLLLQTLFPH